MAERPNGVKPERASTTRGDLLRSKFAWGRGYGAFSVSHSGVDEVANYIASQEEQLDRQSSPGTKKSSVPTATLFFKML
jgi:hypothetical protein